MTAEISSDTVKFSSSDLVMQAIEQAPIGYIRRRLLYRMFRNHPNLRAEFFSDCIEQCQADCAAMGMTFPTEGDTISAVDWQRLIQLIIEYLPTIIRLLLMLF